MAQQEYIDKYACLKCLEKMLFRKMLETSHVIKIIPKESCKINANSQELHNSYYSKIEV